MQVLLLTAQVTDPDGLDDVVGGVARTSTGSAVYGVFTQVSEGTYTLPLTWGTVDDAEPIFFEGTGMLEVLVEFTDASANVGTDVFEIPFDCGGPQYGVCGDRECRLIVDDVANCGGCDDQCGDNEMCEVDACVPEPKVPPPLPWFACFETWKVPEPNCGVFCGYFDVVCAAECDAAAPGYVYADENACDDMDEAGLLGTLQCNTAFSDYGNAWARCCCPG